MKHKLVHKILIIDDDSNFYQLLKDRFRRCGFRLSWAKDGIEGLEKIQSDLPDIVITDIVMPKMNGFELIKATKEKNISNIIFVVLSSYGEGRHVYDKSFLESLGIKKYLVKSNHTPIEIVKEVKALVS